MALEDLIKQIKTNSRLKFKNDNTTYYNKNLSLDKKNIFVTLNGQQTYRKSLKNLIQVDNYKLQINEESLKNLLIKKIEDSSLSKEEKEKLLKQYKDSGYDYKIMKQLLLKIDQPQMDLKEIIKKTLQEKVFKGNSEATKGKTQTFTVSVTTDGRGITESDIADYIIGNSDPDYIIEIDVKKEKTLKESKSCSCKH